MNVCPVIVVRTLSERFERSAEIVGANLQHAKLLESRAANRVVRKTKGGGGGTRARERVASRVVTYTWWRTINCFRVCVV